MHTTMTIKEMNMDRIKSALKLEEYSTKLSLSSATGLSVATCGNILRELEKTGEVNQIELNISTGGRPSKRYIYNKEFAYILCMYPRKEGKINSLNIVIGNLLGEKIYEETREYEQISISEFEESIGRILGRYNNIKVLSLGVPGVVQKGFVKYCDFELLMNLDLTTLLKSRFDLNILVENDVNASALGFIKRIEESERELIDSLAYIYYPVDGGVGAGIIVNKGVVRGATNYAGEVGNLPFGLTCSEQALLQRDVPKFYQLVAKTIIAINCVINPQSVVLSGLCFDEKSIETIIEKVKESLPSLHLPEISFEKDYHESYIGGLMNLGLESLACQYRIIER